MCYRRDEMRLWREGEPREKFNLCLASVSVVGLGVNFENQAVHMQRSLVTSCHTSQQHPNTYSQLVTQLVVPSGQHEGITMIFRANCMCCRVLLESLKMRGDEALVAAPMSRD